MYRHHHHHLHHLHRHHHLHHHHGDEDGRLYKQGSPRQRVRWLGINDQAFHLNGGPTPVFLQMMMVALLSSSSPSPHRHDACVRDGDHYHNQQC